MRVAVLGIGGIGRAVVSELVAESRVKEIVPVDRRGERARFLKYLGRTATVTPVEMDVTDAGELRRVLSGLDVAVNVTPPANNAAVMRACLEAGCDYVDYAGLSPSRPGEPWGVLEQLALDDVWKRQGRTALLSMGSDPGISNVLARLASEGFASVDAVRIRVSAGGGPAIDGYPLYSREIFLRDALARPLVWDEGRHVERDPVSEFQEFEFPAPVGRRTVALLGHEEVCTLPLRLGKSPRRIDYENSIDPHLLRAIHALAALGLFQPGRFVDIAGRRVPFRDVFLAALPEPSTLITPLSGCYAIVTEVDGVRPDGSRGTTRAHMLAEHKEANRRRGTTADHWVSAVALASAVSLFDQKKFPRTGVLVPEELPSDIIVPELERRGVHLAVSAAA